ncbi:Lrp/AsnC family transcriptional regulator [Allonocardiopsis opalescens]|uniref:DNA-binding Lrp family transcriptional regulator n=1 Tax=Allonocardiopsis opalescens TaxID=1144618 RepID=A0A2T0PWJ4_9ACTN|nr:Lrp/AsnC family transcriptional regulator [Allonocardiopsis opalescens]PRX95738.1 DNA-binding Lrp family transcriptional regulator [Allonocardiopsis opalescens]
MSADARARLDALDEKIIALLVRDGRAGYAAIGARVGLSAPAAKRRVDRLVGTGAITGFTAVIDQAVLGWSTEAYVELYCSGQPAPSLLARSLAAIPEVVSASTVTGDADTLLRVRAADVRHFERVLERLTALPYVERTRTTLVLSPLFERPAPAAEPPTG